MALLLDTTSPLTIRCATIQDIAAGLAYARQEGLALGADDGVLLDLCALQPCGGSLGCSPASGAPTSRPSRPSTG
jgi:hypothetical protein